ncbi:MAG TPA: hypothetical protein VM529_08955 [Gemmata sp.]|nr:hypothetical protein [Gemmata sp.]
MSEPSLFSSLLADLSRRVSESCAAMGLEVRGELSGLVQDVGLPESAVGFKTPVGGGFPPGWPDVTALLDRVRELEAENARLRAADRA